MTTFIRMDLSGETPQIDGEPAPLPARHRGRLTVDALADLTWSGEADLIDVGYWRVIDTASPSLGLGQTLGEPVLTIDTETQTVVRSREAVWMPLEGRKAVMLVAIRDRYREIANGGCLVEVAEGVFVPVATTTDPTVKLQQAIETMTALNLESMAVVTTAGHPVTLTPALAALMLAGIRSHVRDCEATQHALVTAVIAAADDDALGLIDIASGSIGGDGGWP